ncbi:hypothetical protein OHA37_15110 [Streptomyces sp. NBC_00335]|uniref:hypothetical protein n=1 Tax=unclassified Streptomyces TaxID=2593676 RepID=UPI0022565449|nr:MULTISPECIES: hypothetical protein [unclassified Streptomyces]MCX5405213.1 hypothetical protein [Streptomyces sp. NBC_00086]
MGKKHDGGAAGPDGPEVPAVSDEDWARFLAEAEAGAGEAPKEPSARARMVTERLRHEEEQRAAQQKKRFGRAKPVSTEPAGWRTGPAWQEREGRGKAKRRIKAALAIAFVVALALIAIRPELVIDKVTGQAEQDAKAGQPLAAETARPSAAPSMADPDLPTLKEPFKGSPAAQWADGAAGIEIPQAEAVGGMSKEKIADALVKVRQFLVTANLDPATLRGERPEAALALLDPKLGEYKTNVEEALRHPSAKNDPLDLFSRYDPAELTLVGEVVKVRGRIWVEPGDRAGQVDLKTDYTFVYPFVKAKAGADQVERTVMRREITFSIVDPRKWDSTAGKLWIEATYRNIGNSACDADDGFLHPQFDDDAPTGPTPSGTPVDPYDRSKGLETDRRADCGILSRS